MKLDHIEPGLVLWTVLTTDPNGEPITQLIRGIVTGVGDQYTFGFKCDWEWAGGKVYWCYFAAEEVSTDPMVAVNAWLADRAVVLWRDVANLLEDNVVIPNGWEGPDWRGHCAYKLREPAISE